MTAARQKRKRDRTSYLSFGAVVLALAAGLGVCRATATERIVVDWHTGLAIAGYDPVAYFTDGKQRLGSADFELRAGGVIWRFCNIGDRAAFAERPDVYMPQFGGYDPLGVARGVAVAGNPNAWLIVKDRLFLFYDPASLQKFQTDQDGMLAQADRRWPGLLATLNP